MKFKPLGERALVQIVEREETTASGIVLPDTAKEKPQTARVVAVGEGKLDKDGQRVPVEAARGRCHRLRQVLGDRDQLRRRGLHDPRRRRHPGDRRELEEKSKSRLSGAPGPARMPGAHALAGSTSERGKRGDRSGTCVRCVGETGGGRSSTFRPACRH